MMEEEYQLEFFKNYGFQRKLCSKCGIPFWTQNPEQDTCNDTPCVEYGFIGQPLMNKQYDMTTMRNKFLKFFEKNDHKILKRYPVIARWRDDIYFTIASIADFQPHVTSGEVPPPANPLVISQPCIRFVDIDIVGKSGRHMSNFEMMGHHVFNTKDNHIYWKSEAVEYCHLFFSKDLGIPSDWIVYKENPWCGGGNAGPAVEIMVKGLELATLVFMSMKQDDAGEFEVKGLKYTPMATQVVDPGYGLERMVWASHGTYTIYDAVYPELIKDLIKSAELEENIKVLEDKGILNEYSRLAGMMSFEGAGSIIELRKMLVNRMNEEGLKFTMDEFTKLIVPLENIYTIADHTRCLTYMLGDGIVPSNVKAGYLARLVLRRTLRLLENLGLDISLVELVNWHVEEFKVDFPELGDEKETMFHILELEKNRYTETLRKGKRLVQEFTKSVDRSQKMPTEKLIDFYDTYGIHPTQVQKFAGEEGFKFEIPENFNALLAEHHARSAPKKIEEKARFELPETILHFYDDEYKQEFDAKVLYSKDKQIILDETYLYPEGGGQPGDEGTISANGKTVKVIDVQKSAGVVIHNVDSDDLNDLSKGTEVHCTIDWDRRMQLMRNHTGTHVVNGAARALLGSHIWQTGAQKGLDRSRLDITHYAKLTAEELQKIEMIANEAVLKGYEVDKAWLPRDKAELEHGFRLYQGGVPPGKKVRVVNIKGFDVEACAGTHLNNTREIGMIKLLRSERIQDGVERLEFSVGLAAVEQAQAREKLLYKASNVYNVPPEQLPKTAERFFTEVKSLRKEVQELHTKTFSMDAILIEETKNEGKMYRRDLEEGISFSEKTSRKTHGTLTIESKVGNVKIIDRTINQPLKSVIPVVRNLITEAEKNEEKIIAVFGIKEEITVKLIIARTRNIDIDLREIIKPSAEILGGGSGGKPDFVQAGGPKVDKLEDAIKIAKAKIEDILK
jgi:alanyl-tRNA synthetase